MVIYNKEQLRVIKEKYPLSIYKKIKRINCFINNDWDKYIEAIALNSQGQTTWDCSTSIADLKFFETSQQNILNEL